MIGPWDRSPLPSPRNKEVSRLSTGRHLNSKETHGRERQDEHEQGEDQCFAPFAAEYRPAEHIDQPDDESDDAGADDVADSTEHRCSERNYAEVESDVPLEV